MDTQQVYNLLFGALGFGGAWWINNVWAMVRSLQQQVTALNVELVKNYVPRSELQETFTRLFDAIEEIKREVNHISRNQAQTKAMQDAQTKIREGK